MTTTTTAIALLTAIIAANGPVPAARVSSAKAKGRAGRYPYWGAARYEVRLTKDGELRLAALEAARSDRRSRDLAERDGRELATAEGRVFVSGAHPGRVSEDLALEVLRGLGAIAARAVA